MKHSIRKEKIPETLENSTDIFRYPFRGTANIISSIFINNEEAQTRPYLMFNQNLS